MYTIRTEASFDAAHFLSGYEGKCSNLHGHRWRVVAEIAAEALSEEGQTRGMVTDFGEVKRVLHELADIYDHTFLYERGTLRETTIRALSEEGFSLCELPFRPTAENLAKRFYDRLEERGFAVRAVEVFETPGNSAVYTK